MTNRILIPFALIGAVGALAVAGCGGGGDSSSTSTNAGAPLSEAAFVSQGNAICAAGNKELDQAASEAFTGGKPTDPQLQQFADAAVPNIQGQIDAIRALQPPESMAADVTTFLADAQDALDQAENDPSVFATQGSNGPFADVNDEATQLGLDVCASG